MIQVSQDGKNWKTIYTIPDQPAFAMQYIKEFSGETTARYVRYTVPEGAPQNFWNADDVYCCNLSELEIYGDFVGEIVDPEETVVPGDVNQDGKVLINDAVLILQYLGNPDVYKLSEKELAAADVSNTGDGVTNKDALAIQRYALNLISALPED